jgi:hypothetical protein
MFKYDSTHGPYKGIIKVIDEFTLEIDGKKVSVTSKRYAIDMAYGHGVTLFSAQAYGYYDLIHDFERRQKKKHLPAISNLCIAASGQFNCHIITLL